MSNTPQNRSIETMGGQLAVAVDAGDLHLADENAGLATFRTTVRALEGMQKEAIVVSPCASRSWQLVCDEGPYLNGTDLAPPPLGFFSAGMASCYVDALQTAAGMAGTRLLNVELVQDNRYSMEGSAIRGTMIAGALPVELAIDAEFEDPAANAVAIIRTAVGGSPIDALMRDALVDKFSITKNGTQIEVGKVVATNDTAPPSPLGSFPQPEFTSDTSVVTDAVSKLKSTESVFETDHGSGAAMKESQKRELHIRSILTLRSDGLREIRVQIFKPIGSVFRFLADDANASRAPSGQTLVSAGIAFCFMTQIGRYTGIVKKTINNYGVIQDATFDVDNGITHPIVTHTYIDSPESDDDVRQFVDMGEQTCFLHGACRMSNKTRLIG